MEESSMENVPIEFVRRQEQHYIIDEGFPSEEDLTPEQLLENNLDELSQEVRQKSISSRRKAEFYRVLQVLSSIFITISGSVIAILTLEHQTNSKALYGATILGFTVSTVQALISLFAVEKRSVLLRESSNRLRTICRELKSLKISKVDLEIKQRKLEDFFLELDELDRNMFDNTISNKKETHEIKQHRKSTI